MNSALFSSSPALVMGWAIACERIVEEDLAVEVGDRQAAVGVEDDRGIHLDEGVEGAVLRDSEADLEAGQPFDIEPGLDAAVEDGLASHDFVGKKTEPLTLPPKRLPPTEMPPRPASRSGTGPARACRRRSPRPAPSR